MMDERLLDLAIFSVAGLLALIGLMMIVGGLFGRTQRSRYQVQRLQARRDSMVRALRGVGLLAISALLFGIGFFFQSRNAPVQATPLQPTAVPTVQQEPTSTPEPPKPTELPSVVIEATQAPTDEPPLATPTPIEPQPTPTPTDIPTATPIPYDAYVNVVGGLNMRDTPNGLVTVLLPNGAGMTLLNEAIAAGPYLWQKVVSEEGDEGWVAEEFIVYGQQ